MLNLPNGWDVHHRAAAQFSIENHRAEYQQEQRIVCTSDKRLRLVLGLGLAHLNWCKKMGDGTPSSGTALTIDH